MEQIKKKIQTLKGEVEIKGAKIVTLKARIDNEKERVKRAENDATEKEKKLSEVEDELDDVEEEIVNARKLLNVVQEERDEKEHELRKYGNTDEITATLKQQTYQLQDEINYAIEAENKFEEANSKLQALEDELMETEERLEVAIAQNKEFNDLLHGASTDLKSLQATKSKMSDKKEVYIDKIEMLETKLVETEDAYSNMVRKVTDLNSKNDKLEDEIEEVTARIEGTKEELQSTLLDLADV